MTNRASGCSPYTTPVASVHREKFLCEGLAWSCSLCACCCASRCISRWESVAGIGMAAESVPEMPAGVALQSFHHETQHALSGCGSKLIGADVMKQRGWRAGSLQRAGSLMQQARQMWRSGGCISDQGLTERKQAPEWPCMREDWVRELTIDLHQSELSSCLGTGRIASASIE